MKKSQLIFDTRSGSRLFLGQQSSKSSDRAVVDLIDRPYRDGNYVRMQGTMKHVTEKGHVYIITVLSELLSSLKDRSNIVNHV